MVNAKYVHLKTDSRSFKALLTANSHNAIIPVASSGPLDTQTQLMIHKTCVTEFYGKVAVLIQKPESNHFTSVDQTHPLDMSKKTEKNCAVLKAPPDCSTLEEGIPRSKASGTQGSPRSCYTSTPPECFCRVPAA